MVRALQMIPVTLALAISAGTCLAQEKPQEPPSPEAEARRQAQEKEAKIRAMERSGGKESKETSPASDAAPVMFTSPQRAEQPAGPAPAPAQPTPQPAAPMPGAAPPGAAPIPGKGAVLPPVDPGTPQGVEGKAGVDGKAVVAPSEPGALPKPVDSPVPPDMVRLGPFSADVDVKLLVDLVQQELKIQIIATDQALRDKKVSLMPNAIEIKRSDLLPFLQYLLELNGQILTRDVAGIWVIRPQTDLNAGKPGEEYSTTQVVSTMGLKPSSLQNAITAGMKAAPGAPAAIQPAYLDDLGVIVVTDTPRRIAALQALISRIAMEQQNAEVHRFDLKHIAAPVARVRILELAGQFTRSLVPGGTADPNAAAINQAATSQSPGGSPNTSNLATRLIVNPQGNGLLFRGRADERQFLEKLVPIVDMPNELEPRYYDIQAPRVIAEQASRQGLGELKVMSSQRDPISGATGVNVNQPGQQAFGAASAITEIGGPCFIVDPEGRGFMYYGTPEQHARLTQIVEQFREAVKRDDVVYEFYKLKHASAPDTAELIRGLIANQAVGGSSSLLPGGNRNQNQANRRATTQPNQPNTANRQPQPAPAGSELGEIVASDDIFVQADERNNQLVVKAPKRLQPQFAKLIERLDLRRAQVYLDCKIVVVTETAESRIAVESQLINSGATGGALRTLFPPSAMPIGTSGNITQIPVIVPAAGATAAIIKTGSVAATIVAIANTTDARIVAAPQLLVDDNEEAEVASLEQRPTSTQTQSSGAGTTLTGFGGYEDAGPKLKVKPRISTSNSLSVKYEVELSSFQPDAAISSDLPPPKQKNNIKSDSVTLPSDSTLVVGGLTFDQRGKTVIKVPLLGDIPIVGQLFRDERTTSNRRTLYVFITPRVMRDNSFDDLRLNTIGPASAVRITDPLPPAHPTAIPIVDSPEPLRNSQGDINGWTPAPSQPIPISGDPAMPPDVNNRPPMPPAPKRANTPGTSEPR